MSKGLRVLLKDLSAQGFRAEAVKKGWMIFPPDKTAPPVVVHGTPSDRRAYSNLIADLRRCGYKP